MSRHTFWQRLVAVLGVALLVAVGGSRSPAVWADPKDTYSRRSCFWVIRRLGVASSSTSSSQMSSTIAVMSCLAPTWHREISQNKASSCCAREKSRRLRALANPPRAGATTTSASSRPPPSTTGAMWVLPGCSNPSVFPTSSVLPTTVPPWGERGRLSLLPEHPYVDAGRDS
jgi:hypothetical protein